MEKKNVHYNLEQEWDETFQMLDWFDKEKVRNAKVMVVGAGALGNEVLKNLALLNVGYIVIVDFDIIEYSNLSRSVLFREEDCKDKRKKAEVAAERIKQINPHITVKIIDGDITCDVGLGLIRRMDVVTGCLDNRLARRDINRACYKTGKIWVEAAIEDLMGKVNTFIPNITCYECTLSKNEHNYIRYQMGCADVAKRNLAQGRIPTTPISSSVIGAVQALEALKVIHGYNRVLLSKNYFHFEGMNNEINFFQTAQLKESCLSHFTYDNVIEIPNLTTNSTVKEAMEILCEKLNDPNPVIRLDHTLVLEFAPEDGDKSIPYTITYPHLSDDITAKYKKTGDERIFITKDTDYIDKDFPQNDLTLREIGIPALHIMRVVANKKENYVELTGDAEFFGLNPPMLAGNQRGQ